MNTQEFGLESKHFSDEDLLQATLAQLQKDFGQIELGLEKVERGPDYFSRLCIDLSYTIDALLDKVPEKLFGLMYRVDLPESRIKVALSGDNPAYEISELLLKRELQKVVIRRRFS